MTPLLATFITLIQIMALSFMAAMFGMNYETMVLGTLLFLANAILLEGMNK